MRSAFILLLTTYVACCSFSSQRPPSGYKPEDGPPDCRRIRADLVDMLSGAALAGLGTLIALPSETEETASMSAKDKAIADEMKQAGLAIVGVGIAAGLFGLIYGRPRVQACRDAYAQWKHLKMRQKEATKAAAVTARAERAAKIARLRETPKTISSVLISNGYAESIFRLFMYFPLQEKSFTVIDQHRISANGKDVFKGALKGWRDNDVEFTLKVMSLGQWYTFEFKTTFQPNKTLRIHYDWDMATAEFRAQARWN